MKVNARQVGTVTVAELTGEIDTLDTEGMGDALAALAVGKPQGLVLDLTGVTYIASMGLSMLLKLTRDVRKAGGKLVIAGVNPAVRTVLDTVHLGSAIPIETTVEGALARLAGKAAVPA